MGLVYRCWCTRSEIAEALKHKPVRHGPDGPVYPGTCKGRSEGAGDFCWRLDMEAAVESVGPLSWTDLAAGEQMADPMHVWRCRAVAQGCTRQLSSGGNARRCGGRYQPCRARNGSVRLHRDPPAAAVLLDCPNLPIGTTRCCSTRTVTNWPNRACPGRCRIARPRGYPVSALVAAIARKGKLPLGIGVSTAPRWRTSDAAIGLWSRI
jgi:hypothetical protein